MLFGLECIPSVVVPNAANPEPGDGSHLHLYVIYDVTTMDYPGRYVLRRNISKPGRIEIDQDPMVVSTDLAEVRRALPSGLHRMTRFAEDDPVILEVWL